MYIRYVSFEGILEPFLALTEKEIYLIYIDYGDIKWNDEY